MAESLVGPALLLTFEYQRILAPRLEAMRHEFTDRVRMDRPDAFHPWELVWPAMAAFRSPTEANVDQIRAFSRAMERIEWFKQGRRIPRALGGLPSPAPVSIVAAARLNGVRSTRQTSLDSAKASRFSDLELMLGHFLVEAAKLVYREMLAILSGIQVNHCRHCRQIVTTGNTYCSRNCADSFRGRQRYNKQAQVASARLDGDV